VRISCNSGALKPTVTRGGSVWSDIVLTLLAIERHPPTRIGSARLLALVGSRLVAPSYIVA
jgi:hypothetical protein